MPTCYLLAASRLWHHKPVSPDTPLQRDAPYVQIIEHYRQQIRDGRLQDGDMLPSGREIAAEFGVSLATVIPLHAPQCHAGIRCPHHSCREIHQS